MQIKILPSAENDLKHAVEHYKEIELQLSYHFLNEFHDCLNFIQSFPEGAPEVGKGFRRVIMHHFPYIIIYKTKNETIQIYAIFHQKKNREI